MKSEYTNKKNRVRLTQKQSTQTQKKDVHKHKNRVAQTTKYRVQAQRQSTQT